MRYTGWAKRREQGLCWVVADRTHGGGATGTFGGALIWGHATLYWVGETRGARAVLGGGGRMRA
eukprot:4502884-Pyramimonas_sp.AAC.1